jgi:Ni,Fe-hydrogenase III small subunit/Pyruvate/2-oxoacid:ferredoxin oxidoreductase delta subunit
MTLWTFHSLMWGKASTGWPLHPGDSGQEGVLGMPRYRSDRVTSATARACADACPTDAIQYVEDAQGPRLAIDYGRCIACQLCVEAVPDGPMEETQDWAFAVTNRDDLATDPEPAAPPAPNTPPGHRYRRSLHVRHIDAGSCNGCESELQALGNPFYNLHRLGIFFTPSPRFADVLLVTGPVTPAMKQPLIETWEAMPDPKWIVATGACAISGGIMAGGYSGGRGVGEWLPVDVHVPGCPPNPAAIIQALLLLQRRMPQRVHGGRYGE